MCVCHIVKYGFRNQKAYFLPGSASPLTAGLSFGQAFNQFISGTSFSFVFLVTETQ